MRSIPLMWPFDAGSRNAPATRWRTREERGDVPHGVRPRLRRRRRPWLRLEEPISGAAALGDLPSASDSDGLRVLTRALVLRLLDPRRGPFAGEVEAVLPYVRALPAGDPERAALESVIARWTPRRPRDCIPSLSDAAAEAEARGHLRGAFALARWAYALARRAGDPALARRAAAQLGRIARSGGDERAADRWTVRAASLAAHRAPPADGAEDEHPPGP